MTYNLSFASNATTLYDLSAGMNAASGGWLFGGLLFFFYLMFFISFRNQDIKTTLLADGFLTSVLAGFLLFADLIEPWVAALAVVTLVIGVVVKVWGDS